METKLQVATSPKPVDQFLAELKAFVEEHHPKKTKMIQAIVNGTASKQALQAIAGFGFAIESPAAEWGRMLHDGFKNNHDFDDKAMRFWVTHLEEDDEGAGLEEQHGENARRLMERFAATQEQQERIGKAFIYS